MLRSSYIGLGLAVTALLAFQLGGCSSSGGSGGKGGTTGTAGSSAGGTGGTSAGGTGGTSAGGTGGTSAGGTGGTSAGGKGGSSAGTGGSSGTGGTGTGGTGTGGTGTGGTGTGGTGTGGTGTGGTPGFGQPACPGTVAKGLGCAPSDPQLCYKNCGPQNIGRKSETCSPNPDGGITDGGTTSSYTEMTGCAYDPAGDYSCYKVPTTANSACPAPADGGTGTFGMPQASQACSVATCTPCNSLGGLATGQYLDSNAAMKQGFCVCVANKWSCASDTAWPCGSAATTVNPGCQ